jgi:signal-transduction protein with cAMP-binding, CBS, and nucleotidyltransferase domain
MLEALRIFLQSPREESMKVKDVMTGPALEVSAEDSCRRAAELMRDHDPGMLVVTRVGVIEGVITDRDLVTRCVAIGADPGKQIVGDYFDRNAVKVDEEYDLERAMTIMRNAGVRRIPVTRGITLVGVLSMDDMAVHLKKYVDAFLALAGQYHEERV